MCRKALNFTVKYKCYNLRDIYDNKPVMPQLPTSTAEEYGAEDEIKQYNQEEDECSDTSTVDVVNDIKDDLLNEDGRDSVSFNLLFVYLRYMPIESMHSKIKRKHDSTHFQLCCHGSYHTPYWP